MPIDPRIALQAIGIQAPDVLGAMAQGQQYRQNQMAQQAAQATAQRNAMIRQRAAATDFTNPDAVNMFVREAGPDATPYLEAAGAGDTLFSARAAAARDETKFNTEQRVSLRDFLQREVGSFLNAPTDANIAASRARAIAQGIDAADFDAYVAPYVALPEGDRAARLQNELGTTEEGRALLKTFAPTYDMQNAGGSIIPVQTNALVPGATAPRPITVTPDPSKFNDIATANGIVRVYGDGRTEALQAPGGGPLQEGLSPADQRAQAETDAEAAAERTRVAQMAEANLYGVQNTRGVIAAALPNISHWTAGLGSVTAVVPGSPAANLAGDLETLEANLSFEKLAEMRANSPTGGALGNITNTELKLLGASMRSLRQSQGPEQLRRNLAIIDASLARLEAAYAAAGRPSPVGGGAGGGANLPPVGPEGARVRSRSNGTIMVSRGGQWVPE